MGKRRQDIKRLALIVMLMMSAMAAAQDIKHALTVEQCRADAKLWLKQTHEPAKEEIGYRVLEMADCADIDSDVWLALYKGTEAATLGEVSQRMLHFIQRHHLETQYKAEEAAGKR